MLGKYIRANKQLLPDKILKINGSTEPALMAEMDVVMIPGDEGNYKITTGADLSRFCAEIQCVGRNETVLQAVCVCVVAGLDRTRVTK